MPDRTTILTHFQQGLLTARQSLSERMEARGIRPRWMDLSLLVRDYAPASAERVMDWGLSFFVPFLAGRGLRIARLSEDAIELVLPNKNSNLDHSGQIHFGALQSAGYEAARLLWERCAPVSARDWQLLSVEAEFPHSPEGSVRLQCQLSELERERLLSEYFSTSLVEHSFQVRALDKRGLRVMEMSVRVRIAGQLKIQGGEGVK